jgi:hypothetical protein
LFRYDSRQQSRYLADPYRHLTWNRFSRAFNRPPMHASMSSTRARALSLGLFRYDSRQQSRYLADPYRHLSWNCFSRAFNRPPMHASMSSIRARALSFGLSRYDSRQQSRYLIDPYRHPMPPCPNAVSQVERLRIKTATEHKVPQTPILERPTIMTWF